VSCFLGRRLQALRQPLSPRCVDLSESSYTIDLSINEVSNEMLGAMGLISGIVPKAARQGLFGEKEETEIEKIFSSADRKNPGRAATRATRLRPSYEGHKYFFAINLYNSFDVIPDLFSNMFKVSAILGYHNVFVSVYENGSTDQTKALLRIFDALCRSVGLRVIIRTSLRTRGAFHHRIEYLAEVRNAALAPLQELRDSEGEVFDSIIFMNDVLPCVDDLLELVWQSRRQNAGITCGSDYIFHDEVVSVIVSTLDAAEL
jgi:alpha-1,3-mannosyltransferase